MYICIYIYIHEISLDSEVMAGLVEGGVRCDGLDDLWLSDAFGLHAQCLIRREPSSFTTVRDVRCEGALVNVATDTYAPDM
jgi:hypothetical protein